jgi:hypothetical protein
LDTGHHQCRGETFARGIANDQRQAVIRKRHEVVAIAAEGANLPAPRTVIHGSAVPTVSLHESLLNMAGEHPVLANVNYCIVGRHYSASTGMSFPGAQNRQAAPICDKKNFFRGM